MFRVRRGRTFESPSVIVPVRSSIPPHAPLGVVAVRIIPQLESLPLCDLTPPRFVLGERRREPALHLGVRARELFGGGGEREGVRVLDSLDR